MKYDRFKLSDLNPVIVARKLLTLVDLELKDDLQTIIFDISKLYSFPNTLETMESSLQHKEYELSHSLNEQLNEVMSTITGMEFTAAKERINMIKYYNDFLLQHLDFLKSGLGYMEDFNGLQAYIREYRIIKTEGLMQFEVECTVNELIAGIRKFKSDYMELQHKLEEMGRSSIEGNAPSLEKQGELFIRQLKILSEHLGNKLINMSMNDWGMRMSLFRVKNHEVVLHPFNMDYNQKSLLPLLLELDGILDIHNIYLVNSIDNVEMANVQYCVSTPSTINVLNSVNSIIPIEIKRTLSEGQIVIFYRIYDNLQNAMVFFEKPELKKSFIDLFLWVLKKVQYSLEEESFLRDKAISFINDNKSNSYEQVEDKFFLPFIYEKLVDQFGSKRIVKKQEKSKGEVDLMFDNSIPIELKVWKKKKRSSLDLANKQYAKNLKQAAAYANIERVAMLLILDISNIDGQITNLDNSFRVSDIKFDINEQLCTKIITCIFNCNYISPSSLN